MNRERVFLGSYVFFCIAFEETLKPLQRNVESDLRSGNHGNPAVIPCSKNLERQHRRIPIVAVFLTSIN